LLVLFVFGLWSSVIAESVAELESALRNCQNSWRTMHARYQQECGQIGEVARHANEIKARLDRADMPLSLRSKHAKCTDLYNECHEIRMRWEANYDACVAAGGNKDYCGNTQSYMQFRSQNLTCWDRYDACRKGYDKENDEWQASVTKQRELYDADMQKIRACQQLEGQYRSVVESCLTIEKNLNVARGNVPGRPQQASGTNCVSIDGPRADGQNVTFTAVLDQNTRANLLNVQGAYGFTWLVDGRPQESTNSVLTIRAPGGGNHQIKVQFWVRRQSTMSQQGPAPITCEASKPFYINQPQEQTPRGRIGT